MKYNENRARSLFILLLLALFFTLPGRGWSSPSNSGPEKPELWNRAVTTYALSRNLVPGRLLVSFAMLSSKGEVSEDHEQEVRNFLDEKTDSIQSEILWARENGKDVTEKVKSEGKKRSKNTEKPNSKKKSITLGHDDLPFAMSRQPDLSVRETADRKNLEGHRCQGFDFTMRLPPKDGEDEPTLMKGRAWIDEEKGLPMELSFTPEPLPSKVKSMISTYTFQTDAQDRWVVKELTMEGVGGFLFIKKRFRSRIVMSDYFPKPEK